MISIQFMLRKQGKDIGQITWERETINKRGFELPVSGKLSGDDMAVRTLQSAINKALSAQVADVSPLPAGGSLIEAPLVHDSEMISVFDHAGFDIPPEFDEIIQHMAGSAHGVVGVCY